jgi:hypothetical protein
MRVNHSVELLLLSRSHYMLLETARTKDEIATALCWQVIRGAHSCYNVSDNGAIIIGCHVQQLRPRKDVMEIALQLVVFWQAAGTHSAFALLPLVLVQQSERGLRELYQNRLHRCIASMSSILAARILTIFLREPL